MSTVPVDFGPDQFWPRPNGWVEPDLNQKKKQITCWVEIGPTLSWAELGLAHKYLIYIYL
jgi:hypothetical protein